MESGLRAYQTHYQISLKPTDNLQLEQRMSIEKHYINIILHATSFILK